MLNYFPSFCLFIVLNFQSGLVNHLIFLKSQATTDLNTRWSYIKTRFAGALYLLLLFPPNTIFVSIECDCFFFVIEFASPMSRQTVPQDDEINKFYDYVRCQLMTRVYILDDFVISVCNWILFHKNKYLKKIFILIIFYLLYNYNINKNFFNCNTNLFPIYPY